MILSDALLRHRGALRASLRASYQIDLSAPTIPWFEVADLVAWLPPGAPLWLSYGGPMSVSVESELLRWVDYRLKILVWSKTEDAVQGRNRPKPPEKLKMKREVEAVDAKASARAAAWQRRQELRDAHRR